MISLQGVYLKFVVNASIALTEEKSLGFSNYYGNKNGQFQALLKINVIKSQDKTEKAATKAEDNLK